MSARSGVLVALPEPVDFHPLPGAFFAALAAMVVAYLGLIVIAKRLFYRSAGPARPRRPRTGRRHLRRRTAYFHAAR